MPPSMCRERRRVGPSNTSHLAIRIALFAVTVTSSFANAVSRTAAAPVPFGGPAFHRYRYMYFRGHENTNATDEDDPAQTAQPSVSPQSSGWIPSRYPNPRIDPLRCNIRDMITANHGKQVGDRDGSSTSISPEDDEAKAGTVADGSGGEGQHPSNKEDLLLCDPDYALGTHYL